LADESTVKHGNRGIRLSNCSTSLKLDTYIQRYRQAYTETSSQTHGDIHREMYTNIDRH